MIFDTDDIYEIEEDYKIKLEEKDKEIERLTKELEFEKQIKKEVREYVNKMWLAKLTPDTVSQTKFELLGILDKEE